jgi:hypothetical protein
MQFQRACGTVTQSACLFTVTFLAACLVATWPARAFVLDGDSPISSANKRFYAAPGPGGKSTLVFERIGPKRTKKIWEKPDWTHVTFLSDDGEYMVTGYEGNNLLRHRHAPDEVMLEFYRRGTLLRSIRLNQIIQSHGRLEVADSGVFWGFYEGFLSMHRFAVDTIEQRRLIYDVTTGSLVQVVPSPSPLVAPTRTQPSNTQPAGTRSRRQSGSKQPQPRP